MCHHVKFGSSVTKGVRIKRKEPQNLGKAGTPPLGVGAWLTTLKQVPLPICLTTSNFVVLLQRVNAWIEGNSKNCGALRPRPLAVGALLTVEIHPPHTCFLPNLVVLGQTVRTSLRRSARKKNLALVSRLSGSLKAIWMTRIDPPPMTSCWRSIATMGLSRTVSEIDGDFSRKSQNFHTPRILRPWGFPLELAVGARGQKTRRMGLPGWERSVTISSAIWIQCTNMSDGQTPGDSKDRHYL